MVYVPGGDFLTGSVDLSSDPSVGPLRTVSIPAFYIDRTEMSNVDVKTVWTEHTYPAGLDHHPATALSWNQAVEVLAKVNKRLPSALEWEKAARGTDGRIYPWGSESNFQGRAHVGTPRENPSCGWGHLVEVTALEGGASPFGLLNTLGNAWEWVSDAPTKQRPYHSIKGGAYGYPSHYNRLDNVSFEQPGAT
jgi:formylglycine-generating enzyme required for sulfatase activity